jgi:serine/threonine protein phosphatase PrpC
MVSFKLFAGTDVGLRDNNEDNFTVCPDLTQNEWMMPVDHQQVIPLGECGCLMVVADGMGGQNAGEVASAIAIETVQTMFAPDCLTDKVLSKPANIKDYLKKVVLKADFNIKEYSKEHPEAEGLGSTIVMAWVIGNKAYVAWLGDSRAYVFTPSQGIKRLSKDHSYVQQLVDAGNLSDIEAMNHPNSNVITRSLGDTAQKAKADVEEYRLEDGEIILLCSDGLCGVCTDDEIASVLTEEANDLQVCKELLTELALDNGGSDNITIALMQIVLEEEKGEDGKMKHRKSSKTILATLLILIGISAIGFFGWWMKSKTTVSIPVKEVKVEKQGPVTNRGKRQSKENKIENSNTTKGQKTVVRSISDSLNNHEEVQRPTLTVCPGQNTGNPQPVN